MGAVIDSGQSVPRKPTRSVAGAAWRRSPSGWKRRVLEGRGLGSLPGRPVTASFLRPFLSGRRNPPRWAAARCAGRAVLHALFRVKGVFFGRGRITMEVRHGFALCLGRRSRRHCGSFDAARGVSRPVGGVHALSAIDRQIGRRGRGRPGLVGSLGALASQRMGLASLAPVGLGLASPLCRRASPPLLDRPLGPSSLRVVIAGARSAA